MTHLRRILVAYDGSEGAHRALEQAALGAVPREAQVDLVVVGTPTLGDPEALAREGVTYLLEHGFQPRVQVQYGEPVRVIRTLAAHDHYDAVYLGVRGQSGPVVVTWPTKAERPRVTRAVAGRAPVIPVAAR